LRCELYIIFNLDFAGPKLKNYISHHVPFFKLQYDGYMNKDPQVFLKHILESINLIEKNINDLPEKEFFNNIQIQDAIIRRLEIIGEAVRNLPEDLKQSTPNIPWQDIADMRNKLIHEYFGVDARLVWNVVQNDLPPLKEQVQKLLVLIR